MKDNLVWVLGFCVGFTLVLAVFLILYLVRRKSNEKPQYDERQLTARNQAYKYAFFALLFYSIVCAVLDALEIKWATLTTVMFIGVIGSVMLFAVICILKDAYEGFNQRRNSSIVVLGIVAVINLLVFVFNLFDGTEFFTNGMLNENIMNLCIGVLFSAVAVVQLIKNRINKKAAEDE